MAKARLDAEKVFRLFMKYKDYTIVSFVLWQMGYRNIKNRRYTREGIVGIVTRYMAENPDNAFLLFSEEFPNISRETFDKYVMDRARNINYYATPKRYINWAREKGYDKKYPDYFREMLRKWDG